MCRGETTMQNDNTKFKKKKKKKHVQVTPLTCNSKWIRSINTWCLAALETVWVSVISPSHTWRADYELYFPYGNLVAVFVVVCLSIQFEMVFAALCGATKSANRKTIFMWKKQREQSNQTELVACTRLLNSEWQKQWAPSSPFIHYSIESTLTHSSSLFVSSRAHFSGRANTRAYGECGNLCKYEIEISNRREMTWERVGSSHIRVRDMQSNPRLLFSRSRVLLSFPIFYLWSITVRRRVFTHIKREEMVILILVKVSFALRYIRAEKTAFQMVTTRSNVEK